MIYYKSVIWTFFCWEKRTSEKNQIQNLHAISAPRMKNKMNWSILGNITCILNPHTYFAIAGKTGKITRTGLIIVQMEQFHLIWISRGYKELSPTNKIGEMMSMLWQIGWYIYKYSNLLAGKKIISKGIQRTLQHYWTNWINWTVKYINITSNI